MNEFEPILVAAAGGLLPSSSVALVLAPRGQETSGTASMDRTRLCGGHGHCRDRHPNGAVRRAPILHRLKSDACFHTLVGNRRDHEIPRRSAHGAVASDNDEPIDAVVYMVTVALGFAAVENTLFSALSPLSGNSVCRPLLRAICALSAPRRCTFSLRASSARRWAFLSINTESKSLNMCSRELSSPSLCTAHLTSLY
jgi:hypothetical protein